MVAYSFKSRFVEPIRAGTKRQTIRAVGLRRHARPGDALQLYCGMRTKACFLIARATCFAVDPIRVVQRTWEVEIDGHELKRAELEQLARFDGFHDAAEMRAFWKAERGGFAVFEGYVIHWSAASCVP